MPTESMPIEGEVAERPRRGRPPGKQAAQLKAKAKTKTKTAAQRTAQTRPPIEQAGPEQVRPAVKRDSVREAEEYALKLMDQFGEAVDYQDEFYVDPLSIPPGWTYQWRRMEYLGKEEKFYMNDLKRNGWREVQSTRHPELMPEGYSGPIIKKGLVLMELPSVLVNRSLAKEKNIAQDELRNADAKLMDAPPNTGPRNHPAVARAGLNILNRTIE